MTTKEKTCRACGRGRLVTTTHTQYPYRESGLDNVVLLGGVQTHTCEECGETMVSIPAIAKLHRAIAIALTSKPGRLAPVEVKYLRKYLGYSNEDFAAVMGVKPETTSRWASGTLPISASADRLLRMLVWHGQRVEQYGEADLRAIDDDQPAPAKIEVRKRAADWQSSLAAA